MRHREFFACLAVLTGLAFMPIRAARAQSDSLVEDLFDSNSDPLTITPSSELFAPRRSQQSRTLLRLRSPRVIST